MKGDYLNYRVATSRTFMGLALQIVLGVALLIYSVLSRDHAGMTAAYYVLLGSAAWVTLAVVYDQHRRERIEAMEGEALSAANAGASSVFEEGAAELRVAARRLRAMHKWLVPIMSLAIAGGLIGIGLWRLNTGRGLVAPEPFFEPTVARGWPLGLGVVVAFVGFVFARYVSGMANQPAWANLRAGASWMAGTALLGLSMVVGQFVDVAGPDVILRYIQVAFPGVMIALGAEILLNFVLDLYRPRVQGEVPRPAFDSRILGLVAAPDKIAESINDAINYQLGFNVTSSWFYRLLSRSFVLLVALGMVVLWLLSSLAVVQPHQRGMILRFGRVVDGNVGPGLHVKLPWPIDRLEVPEMVHTDASKHTTRHRTAMGVRVLDVGTPPPKDDGSPILWTTVHADEVYTLVQPSGVSSTSTRSRDLAVVAVEVPLHYAISDVEAYELLGSPQTRDDLLKSVARREVMLYLSTLSVDDILDERRAEISRGLETRIHEAFKGLNKKDPSKPVVDVLFVGAEGVHPPQEVSLRFEQVVEAGQKYKARIQAAKATATRTLTEVVGSVDLASEIVSLLDQAEAKKLAATTAQGEARALLEGEALRLEIEAERKLDEAGGSAAALMHEARAERWRAHMGARARAEQYTGQLNSYLASPRLYRASLYFEALGEAMRNCRVYVTDKRFGETHATIDAQDKMSSVDAFMGGVRSTDEEGGQ